MREFSQSGAGQVVGRREEQQDALGFGVVALADGRCAPLAVLADGMGGHHGGAIAAGVAIDAFTGACRASPERTFTGALEAALLAANRAIAVRSRDDPRLAQMGCTLIAATVEGGVLHYVSVGDSLLWRIGAERIERLNADHSMMPVVTAALARGTMSEAEAKAHGSILRSAVTGRPIELVDLRSVELARDEWLLLASDGILSLGEAEVHAFTRSSGATAQARVNALLDAVEQVGEPDQDNCTVVLLPMTVVQARPTRRPLATVLGTLAVLAGFGVVGAAGWELFRLASPPASGPRARAIPPHAIKPPGNLVSALTAPANSIARPDKNGTRAGKNSQLGTTSAGTAKNTATPANPSHPSSVTPTPTPSSSRPIPAPKSTTAEKPSSDRPAKVESSTAMSRPH